MLKCGSQELCIRDSDAAMQILELRRTSESGLLACEKSMRCLKRASRLVILDGCYYCSCDDSFITTSALLINATGMKERWIVWSDGC